MDTKTYWDNFKIKHPEVTTDNYDAFSLGFAGDTDVNNDLAYLIRDGIKTASASAFDLYPLSGELMPKTGDYSIILDGHDQPVCIIKEINVETHPLKEVSAQHAYNEGEGSRSLEEWRKDHLKFFQKEYQQYNLPFNDNIPIVCETFEVVYK